MTPASGNDKKSSSDDDEAPYLPPKSLSDAQSVTTDGLHSNDDESLNLAVVESRRVAWSKRLVVAVLILAAAIGVVATYRVTKASEEEAFRRLSLSHSDEVIDLSKLSVENVLETVDDLSETISSYVVDQNATWPFVVVPHFHLRTRRIQKITGASSISLVVHVLESQRDAWEKFTYDNQHWVPDQFDNRPEGSNDTLYSTSIYSFPPRPNPDPSSISPVGYYHVAWQISPAIPLVRSYINIDLLTFPGILKQVQEDKHPGMTTLGGIEYQGSGGVEFLPVPTSTIVAHIFSEVDRKGSSVGKLTLATPWHIFFTNILSDPNESMYIVIKDSCGSGFTYRMEGPEVTFQDVGDVHDRDLDRFVRSVPFNVAGPCDFELDIYPTKDFYDHFKTSNPIIYSAVVFAVFLVTSLAFFAYDMLVQRRQDVVMTSAQRTNNIVSSLFPEQVRDRLLEDAQNATRQKWSNKLAHGTIKDLALSSSKPIADLFPHATVLFADICDFTAWSSVREPSQVFLLLECVYGSFDAIAKKRNIFKVETIGDCYVAAAGLPEARKDHAVVMVRYARSCRNKLIEVVGELETVLGPETSDLGMRFGLHSGPVTAGVLRGAKSRFQLFGDTVNTAARIESTGERNKIHMSKETVAYLEDTGKGHWAKPRDKPIRVKGKGIMHTFWLIENFDGSFFGDREGDVSHGDDYTPKDQSAALTCGLSSSATASESAHRNDRLVEWIVEVLAQQLRKVIAMRDSVSKSKNAKKDNTVLKLDISPNATVLEEVKEIISLSDKQRVYKQDPESVVLSDAIIGQLRDYVKKIASYYKPNSFHCFEHATHVLQSVVKLLARVVTADDAIDFANMTYKHSEYSADERMHNFTHGITSDPVIMFACAFSSLIHDVDHQGVSNAQLVKEESALAKMYRNQSVAEQNSVDLAWGLLMEPMYAGLRNCIYQTQDELQRFRSLVVNSVMATDIVDKELGAARKVRWAKAFALDSQEPTGLPSVDKSSSLPLDSVNRKATIVIEHIIQASDVSHTMQHWHIYIKWNERLFHELYKAYLDGRGAFDPSQGEGWYKGELGFFDHYVIPLAKKLQECGVFGVASDEYLNYAIANRAEWEVKGREMVKGYMTRYAQPCYD